MTCRIDELKNKQIVCVKDGCVLGFVSDVELDTENGTLTSVIIFGRLKFFGVLGREEDIVIPWSEIIVIGPETILVSTDSSPYLKLQPKRRRYE